MALAQLSASLSLSIHDVCPISTPRTHKISPLPGSSSSRTGSIIATGSPLLIRGPFHQRKPACKATPFSIKCEQSTQKGSSLDVWLGRLAMVGFAVAITVEISTGKGLLEALTPPWCSCWRWAVGWYIRVPVFVLPPIPQDPSNDLMEWFDESCNVFNSLKDTMLEAYLERMRRLNEMPRRAGDVFCWPFTQHKLVPPSTVTVIDSRCSENLSVYKVQNKEYITQQVDACASWWTQGPDATLQTELARDMGYAAARFGHVMFPENVYEPALECAALLLDGVGKGWATRVYFSDNGSTAIEIALKMAFRKFSSDHGVFPELLENNPAESCHELMVLALKRSYHGDTLGAMEAQAPSSYTGFLQQPWYTGRGLFLDPPTVFMHNGKWTLSLPEVFHSGNLKPEDVTFRSVDEIFLNSRDKSNLAGLYSSYVSQQLSQYSAL